MKTAYLLAIGLLHFACSSDVKQVDTRGKSINADAKYGAADATSEQNAAASGSIDSTVSADDQSKASEGGTTAVEEKQQPIEKPKVTGEAKFTVSEAQSVNQNLGSTKSYVYKVTPEAGFTGKVDLSIDQTAFGALDTGKATAITISPASLDFASGGAKDVTVTVAVGAASPSVKETEAAGNFTLIATSDKAKIESKVNMTINPVFEVKMKGSSAATMVYEPNLTTMNFRAHPAGLKLRFMNMDPAATNIVHGNGSIPHGPTNSPLAASPDGGTTPGGVYEVNIAPTVTAAGSFYSHSYEAGGNRRTMNFGVTP